MDRNPRSVINDGVRWVPFVVEFSTDEGKFSFELFAVDAAHAEMRLEDLKATAWIKGELFGSIQLDKSTPRGGDQPREPSP